MPRNNQSISRLRLATLEINPEYEVIIVTITAPTTTKYDFSTGEGEQRVEGEGGIDGEEGGEGKKITIKPFAILKTIREQVREYVKEAFCFIGTVFFRFLCERARLLFSFLGFGLQVRMDSAFLEIMSLA